jgi:hypothetical protein
MKMQELDHDYQMHLRRGQGDEKLFVVFYNYYTKDTEKTEHEGRPIFRDEVYIRIVTPGDRNNIIERPMRADDKQRFHEQWRLFEAGAADVTIGTRLEEWPIVSRAQVEELKYFGFRTVEHLSEANDNVCAKMAGLTDLKNKAKSWLQWAREAAPLAELHAELKSRDDKIAALEAQVADLAKLARPPEGALPVAAPKK